VPWIISSGDVLLLNRKNNIYDDLKRWEKENIRGWLKVQVENVSKKYQFIKIRGGEDYNESNRILFFRYGKFVGGSQGYCKGNRG
jgi:hypothetical protein